MKVKGTISTEFYAGVRFGVACRASTIRAGAWAMSYRKYLKLKRLQKKT